MAIQPTRSRRPFLFVLTLGLVLAASGASGRSIDAPARGARAVAAPANPAEHIAVIVMENKEYGTVIGSSDAPYLNRLARRKVLLTKEYAVTHPSLPNYISMASGQTYGIRDDKNPSAHRLRGHSVFGQALAHAEHPSRHTGSADRRVSRWGGALRPQPAAHPVPAVRPRT